jgi:hypothetical protein
MIQSLRKSLLFIAAFLFFLAAPCLAGDDISVTLNVDRTEATVVDSIQLVVKISGSRNIDSQPILRGMESFHVTSSGTSSRIEVINGRVNAGVDYTYFIQPKKTGTFQIGPAEVTVEGKTFRSNIATLAIVQQPKGSGMDQGPLFLSADLSSERVYVEEQVMYTLKLYRLVKVSDISLDLPEIENLSFKQLGKPLEYQSIYNGQSYQVLEVRYALIPTKAGVFRIEPAKMNMTVFQQGRRMPRSLFDDPFFSFNSGQPKTLASDPLKLNVLPLPREGRPADFTGLVGKFEIESKLEPSQIKAGESATLTVLLRGRGNVNRLPDFKIPELENTKVYADQPVLEMEPDATGLAGSKTMKWALVPEKEGHYQIPPLSLSFFDTADRQYRVIGTKPLSLSVLPGKAEQVNASADLLNGQGLEGPVKQEVKELGHDILPVHTSIKDLSSGFHVSPGGRVFWLIVAAPLFAYLVTFCGLRFREKSEMSESSAKAKRAARKLARQCNKGTLSSSELTLSIRDYLNDRFGLSLGSLTPDEAVEILRSYGAGLDTTEKLHSMLKRLEDAIYTGKGQERSEMGEDISRLVRQIEKEVR